MIHSSLISAFSQRQRFKLRAKEVKERGQSKTADNYLGPIGDARHVGTKVRGRPLKQGLKTHESHTRNP